jgi:hypothetical protein
MNEKQMSEIATIELPKTMPEKMEALAVNESFPIDLSERTTVYSAAERNFAGTGKKFTARMVKETGEYRVWRTK